MSAWGQPRRLSDPRGMSASPGIPDVWPHRSERCEGPEAEARAWHFNPDWARARAEPWQILLCREEVLYFNRYLFGEFFCEPVAARHGLAGDPCRAILPHGDDIVFLANQAVGTPQNQHWAGDLLVHVRLVVD